MYSYNGERKEKYGLPNNSYILLINTSIQREREKRGQRIEGSE